MKRCIHARNCFLKLPEVFDPSQRPWVQPDHASAEEVAAMIRTCPSGALTFERVDGQNERARRINRVAVLENGPLSVEGDFIIEGKERSKRATLCRCGLSANKPYCDYSHVDGRFSATGEPRQDEHVDSAENGGQVEITRIKNGPLQLKGEAEITSGNGRRLATTSNSFLCRCGASKNKPYCDGSHKFIGFSD